MTSERPLIFSKRSEDRWHRIWQTRNVVACLLWPVSALLSCLVFLRILCWKTGIFKAWKAPVPVIVVGNIYVGGTGKTPFTIRLIHALQHRQMRVGVISRGYGGGVSVKHEPMLVNGNSQATQVGDEPLLIHLATNAAVCVHPQRRRAAQYLLDSISQIDVLIADDGMQHYALSRDVEIMMFDERGIGNGWLLPAGPLREFKNRRRDFTVVNTSQSIPIDLCGQDTYPMRLELGQAWQLSQPEKTKILNQFAGSRVLAAAGIGHPKRFFTSLLEAGLSCETLALPDHFDFSSNPFDPVNLKFSPDFILITEKDAVKCRANPTLRNDARIWVVPVHAVVPDQLIERIVSKILEK